jgi:hypothetical protein
MGEAQRSRIGRLLANDEAGEIKGDMAEICAEAAAYLLDGSVDRTLLFGPVVSRPSDGTSARQWCFIVVGCDRASGEMRHDQLGAETEAEAAALRASVMAALVALRPCVMHDFDDELEMAKWAEAIWPCATITRIREGIETERTASPVKPRGPSQNGVL